MELGIFVFTTVRRNVDIRVDPLQQGSKYSPCRKRTCVTFWAQKTHLMATKLFLCIWQSSDQSGGMVSSRSKNCQCGIQVFSPNSVGTQCGISQTLANCVGVECRCIIVCADPSRYRVGLARARCCVLPLLTKHSTAPLCKHTIRICRGMSRTVYK